MAALSGRGDRCPKFGIRTSCRTWKIPFRKFIFYTVE